MEINEFKVDNSEKFKISKTKTKYNDKTYTNDELQFLLDKNIEKISEFQSKLYAQGEFGILIIIQAMDAAGKDGAVKHVMTGLNPQGVHVTSFKQPSAEELAHDYLWKAHNSMPGRGQIGIFNRSYYEELLVVRVHNLLENEKIPEKFIGDDIWKKRYEQVKDFEKYLYENAIIPIKIFLNVSKDEQKKRLLERIDDKAKNWKFSEADIKEREFWDDYQKCYEEVIENTNAKVAPWYVVPADNKKLARLIISEILQKTLKGLNLEYPTLSAEQTELLDEYKKKLEKS
ncbi:polyphosphate kinase 2 family protein [Clostridium akagii]|uniref:polyphosphate kinase 2 family protein n=1 Tax=Clostridium akagii TaxID=91623 RepID=UPI00047C931C|nr:polyphosphate kinase 2 family protein [Clostridium akagii]